MSILLIVHSEHHGNTRKIAEAMNEVFNTHIVAPQEVTESLINDANIFGLGSGIYAGRHHTSIFDVIKKIPNCNKSYFVFSTHTLALVFFYHKLLCMKLNKKGLQFLGEFSSQGYATYGPLAMGGGMNKGRPNEKDLQDARNFARHIKTVDLSLQ